MTSEFKAENLRFDMDPEAPIARLTIDRPAKLNSITMQMRRDINRFFDFAATEPGIRVIIITGAGDKAFSAGGDIPEFLRVPVPELANLAHSISGPYRCPKPVIAAINGHCYGGGLELALTCDFRIASTNARFAFPEITLGALPGSGGTQRAVRLMGLTRAKALVLTGRVIDAEQAERWGLITEVVAPEDLDKTVRDLAVRLTKLSPVSLSFAKSVLDHATDGALAAGFQMEGKAMTVLCQMEDFKEGVKAWQEKRPAVFHGR